MRKQPAFAQFGAAARRIGALAVCLALSTLGLGLSRSARAQTFITFDVPGSVCAPAFPRCTNPVAINPAGAITGFYQADREFSRLPAEPRRLLHRVRSAGLDFHLRPCHQPGGRDHRVVH